MIARRDLYHSEGLANDATAYCTTLCEWHKGERIKDDRGKHFLPFWLRAAFLPMSAPLISSPIQLPERVPPGTVSGTP
jgi:hypothetical protein